MSGTARDIYQAFLDECSRALMAAEYDALANSMVYPHRMETTDSLVCFDKPEEMVVAAEHFHEFLRAVGATDYNRVCDFASFEPKGDVIAGEHTTFILRGGSFAVEPYRNRMWMRRVEDDWRCSGIAASVSNRTCTILSPDQLRAPREARP